MNTEFTYWGDTDEQGSNGTDSGKAGIGVDL